MLNRHASYSIDALNLPTRVRNTLVRAGVTAVEELADLSDAELLALRGFGSTSLVQVREALARWEREHTPEETVVMEESEAEPDAEDEPKQQRCEQALAF